MRLARGAEFLCSYLGAACASPEQFGGGLPPDVKAVVISSTSLSPPTDREGFARDALAPLLLSRLNRFGVARREMGLFAKARAPNPLLSIHGQDRRNDSSPERLRFAARRGTEHARSASTAA